MPFQREEINYLLRPSERQHVDVVCGVIYKRNGISAERIIITMAFQEGEIFRFLSSKRI
jgi:hypothetical protein